jgi:hypothetical protein
MPTAMAGFATVARTVPAVNRAPTRQWLGLPESLVAAEAAASARPLASEQNRVLVLLVRIGHGWLGFNAMPRWTAATSAISPGLAAAKEDFHFQALNALTFIQLLSRLSDGSRRDLQEINRFIMPTGWTRHTAIWEHGGRYGEYRKSHARPRGRRRTELQLGIRALQPAARSA